MNIALEQTEEYVNGQLKNKYGDAFIRGNNGKQGQTFMGCCRWVPKLSPQTSDHGSPAVLQKISQSFCSVTK